ncbi:MAG: hypothetical protein K2X38_18240 [Gemmataceae bacterium]|nr:hypothetical protein [Gemmataceae bacterium]
MKEIQFSLYEVFGYLLPGTALCAGLGLVFWALYFPQPAILFDIKTAEVWVTFIAFGYVAGHVAQAIGNKIVKRFTSAEEKIVTDANAFPAELVKACREKVAKMLTTDAQPGLVLADGSNAAEPAKDLPPIWLYRFCDDAVLRSGKLGEREVYIYREGFYRGTFVGFVVLTVGLVAFALRLWFGAENGAARIGTAELTGGRVAYFAVLSAFAARFLWVRYWRFAEYRVTQALLGFLTIKDKASDKAEDKDKAAKNETN